MLTDRCILDAVEEMQPVSTADLATYLSRNSATIHYRLSRLATRLSWHYIGRVKVWSIGDGKMDISEMERVMQQQRDHTLVTMYRAGERLQFDSIAARTKLSGKSLRQYLYDLRESGYVKYYRKERKHWYELTDSGVKAAQRSMMVERLLK
jgi:Mn-dependent DtxR family transcriptional regulator